MGLRSAPAVPGDRLALTEALAAAFESSADMMLVTERNVENEVGWTAVYANAAFERETGYTAADLAGLTSVLLRTADPDLLEEAKRKSHRDEDVTMDVRVSRKDGTAFWGAWRARTIAREGQKRRRVITIRNIDDRITAAERIAAHSSRLRQLHVVAASSGRSADRQIEALLEFGIHCLEMESAYVGKIAGDSFTWEHVVFGAGGRVSPSKMRVGEKIPLSSMALRLAIEANDVVAINDLHAVGDPTFDPTLRSYIGAPLVVRGHLHGGVGFVARRVRERDFDADDCDVMRLIAALVGSAEERGVQERRLDALAFHDLLTGLPNRALLEDRLSQTLASAKRAGRVFALHLLDLDHFKAINDRGGHAAGDQALKMIAKRFVSVLRESDTLARLGGDEFVALQPEIDSDEDALRLAERLSSTLRDGVMIGENRYKVGVTIGIALYPRDGADAQALLRSADRAMYAGKDDGRGRVLFAKAGVKP